ncbi:MAG: hypothetical protein GWP02_04625 [Desulfobulbaceae bacterium]|nr:hypothetical protein [Desulfobulbaceae bacterium]
MFRNVGAIVIGVITAFVTVMLVDKIGHIVYPLPAGLDFTDPDAIRPYLATLPVGAFLFILASSVVAVFVGTLVACFIGTAKPRVFGTVVGGFVFAASVANFIAIPHPHWLSLATLAGIVLSTLLAMRLATVITDGKNHGGDPG